MSQQDEKKMRLRDMVTLVIAILIGVRFSWDQITGVHNFEVAVAVVSILMILAAAVLWALTHIVIDVAKILLFKSDNS